MEKCIWVTRLSNPVPHWEMVFEKREECVLSSSAGNAVRTEKAAGF